MARETPGPTRWLGLEAPPPPPPRATSLQQRRCSQLRTAREAAVTPERRAEVKAKAKQHFDLINFERKFVSEFAFRAINEPHKYISFEVDSMDQVKSAMPQFHRPSKDFVDSAVVKNVVTAVRVPGHCVLEYVYQNNSPHDSSTTFTLIHRALQSVAEKKKGSLPPCAHFQMDNCGRENKNNTMFAYFSYLVESGVFNKIVVTFLPVGCVAPGSGCNHPRMHCAPWNPSQQQTLLSVISTARHGAGTRTGWWTRSSAASAATLDVWTF